MNMVGKVIRLSIGQGSVLILMHSLTLFTNAARVQFIVRCCVKCVPDRKFTVRPVKPDGIHVGPIPTVAS